MFLLTKPVYNSKIININPIKKTINKALNVVKKLHPYLRGFRVIVCTVYELVWLASGLTDIMINIKPSIGISSASGKLMVVEAGGKVTNLNGEERKEVDNLLITNGLLHDKVLKILKEEA